MKALRTICGAVVFVALGISLFGALDIVLVWVLLSCFFFDETETYLFSFTAGLVRDVVGSPFGFHMLLYTLLAAIGTLAVKTVMTHRSFFSVYLLAVFFFVVSLSARAIMMNMPLDVGALLYQIIGMAIFISIGYLILDRFVYARR